MNNTLTFNYNNIEFLRKVDKRADRSATSHKFKQTVQQ